MRGHGVKGFENVLNCGVNEYLWGRGQGCFLKLARGQMGK